MFPPSSRRVRRLRLGAESDDDARSAATLLTDALATASLPGADDGRLVVIRRLTLGRISVHASPSSLALKIAEAAGDASGEAVPYDSPSAAAANMVAFPDRGTAIGALARLHARRAPAYDWFWTAAVSGWRPDQPQAERWPLLIEAAHELPEAVAIAAQIVDAAVAAGVEEALIASVPAGRAERWLWQEGWSSFAQPRVPAAHRLDVMPRAQDVMRRCRQQWHAGDARAVWLGTMLAVTENPARAADPGLPAKVAALLTLASDVVDPPRRTPRGRPPVDVRRASRREREGSGAAADAVAAEVPAASDDGRGEHAVAPRARPVEPLHESPQHRAADGPRPDEMFLAGEPSSCAGLLFVVPMLDRLGFGEYVASHDVLLDTAFPSRLLDFIGRRVGMLPRDPLAALAPGGPDEDLRQFTVAGLPAAARALLSKPAPRARLDSPLAAWLAVVRRFARRNARMGLVALIRRPGRVWMSSTHIDVSLDLSLADVRIRRLALDVDPGWVPWLGRVVQFSYRDRHERTH